MNSNAFDLIDLLVPASEIPALKIEASSLPNLTLTHRQICDFELLVNGGFSPLNQFMDRSTYLSVVNDMVLPSGQLFPMPITLDVSRVTLTSFGVDLSNVSALNPETCCDFKLSQKIALRDEEHNLLAIMEITDVYKPNREMEAMKVFETVSPLHPGANYLIRNLNEERFYISGPIRALQLPLHYDYVDMRKTPRQLRAIMQEKQWNHVVAFQTRNPMHRAHRELTMRALENGGKSEGIQLKLLLHPVVGETKPGDIDYHTRVKCYKEVLKTFPENSASLSLLPLAMRMGGPREALWHAIIRKNYGCTHFIVGRDHAGPGDNEQGKPFYEPYAAQEICLAKEKELGIKILPFQMMVYLEGAKVYCPADEVPAGEKIANISGTKLRQLLRTGGEIPAWFTYPSVSAILRNAYPPKSTQGFAVFFTGLSGSGKSTIANALHIRLLEEVSRPVTLLDGDIVRQNLSSELGFSKEHRDLNVQRIGYVASEITKSRGVAICAPIAPYSETRKYVRNMIEGYGNGGFIEIFISTSLEVCENRDRKGLYAKARSGILKNFTGVSDPYEAPVNAEIEIDTAGKSVKDSVQQIINYLQAQGYISKSIRA